MILFKNSIQKNKATSSIKTYEVLLSIGLYNVDIYLRDRPFSSDIGIVFHMN